MKNLFLFSVALAAGIQTEVTDTPVANLPEYVSALLNRLYPIIGAVAVLMFIYAGYIYIASQGKPESLSYAKDIIIGVVTGLVLLFLIQLLLNQIGLSPARLQ